MTPNEIWKPIKGYEGLYEASNLGRIKSLKRAATSGRVLKQYVSPANGYCYVTLYKSNNKKTKRVHKLIYSAFNGWSYGDTYDKEHTIDHIDGDKTNNRLENLDVCTQSENQLRAFRNGLNPVYTRPVIDLTTGAVYNSVKEASESIGGTKRGGSVIRVCKGKRSQYKDHKYAYYDDYLNGTIPKFTGKAKGTCRKLWRD